MNDTKPSFGGSLLGLLYEPRGTTAHLFSLSSPPFILRILTFLVIIVFGPACYFVTAHAFPHRALSLLLAFSAFMMVASIVFTLLLFILLLLFGIEISARKVIAIVIYSLSPLAFTLLLLYLANFVMNGEITFISNLLGGGQSATRPLLRAIPIGIVITQLLVTVVYFYSLRSAGEVSTITALCLVVLSVFPLILSIGSGLIVSEVIYPGSIEIAARAWANPLLFLTENGMLPF